MRRLVSQDERISSPPSDEARFNRGFQVADGLYRPSLDISGGHPWIRSNTDLVPGHAAEVITHYPKVHAHHLIVIGYRGHFLGDYLLGSTADRVTHHALCPVMVVR
jgi:hypothetical protein